MRIDKYDITADGRQFILQEVKINDTIKDGVKSKHFGTEQLVNPSYHTSWDGVIGKLMKLELMASVSELGSIQGAMESFERKLDALQEEISKQLGR